MRIDCSDTSLCCGCSACASACPVSAIRMTEDADGFIVPRIDTDLCIDCGLCARVCDFKKTHAGQSNIEKAFSLVVKDTAVLKRSTSGGAFTVFADLVRNQSGLVAGAVFEEDFTLRHVLSADPDVCARMRGSKYVQSSTEGVFPEVKEALATGRPVLFTGTPCQCAALRSFLGRDYDNLYIIDLLCHGVPSNRLFKDHVAFLEGVYGSKIKGYQFRDKRYGWNAYNNSVSLEGGRTRSRWINQAYYSFFVRNVSLRPACYKCPYRSFERQGDMTVADFWSYQKVTGKKQGNTGISLVFANSPKGLDLIGRTGDVAVVCEVSVDAVTKTLHLNPVRSRLDRDAFWKKYREGGYPALVRSYFDASLPKRMRFGIRKIGKMITKD